MTEGVQMKVQISVQHRKNWQDGMLRWDRREKFVAFMQDAIQSLEIKYQKSSFPITILHEENGNAPPSA